MRRCFFHFSSSAAGISTQLHQHALRTGREIIHACRIKKDAENVEHLAFQRERAAGKLQFRGHQSWSCRIIAPSLVAAFKSFHRQVKDGSFQAFLPGRFKFLAPERAAGRQRRGGRNSCCIPAGADVRYHHTSWLPPDRDMDEARMGKFHWGNRPEDGL